MRGKIVVCNLGGEILLVTRVIAFNKQHKLLLLLFFVGLPSVLQNENICDKISEKGGMKHGYMYA